MDIKEIKEKRLELEQALQSLIDKFEIETETEVHLSLDRYRQIGSSTLVVRCDLNI